jgi:hypothetical protein
MKFCAIATAVVGMVLSGSASGQTVVDGDTIKMAGMTYRLWGIDAPETHQTCADGRPAGRIATEYQVNLMHGHAITCEPRTKDRYGRTGALCRADGVDIEVEMVRNGMWSNTQPHGGLIFVGIEDHGRISGCKSMSQGHKNTPENLTPLCPEARWASKEVAVVNAERQNDYILIFRVD